MDSQELPGVDIFFFPGIDEHAGEVYFEVVDLNHEDVLLNGHYSVETAAEVLHDLELAIEAAEEH
jgi:hypothetical protein